MSFRQAYGSRFRGGQASGPPPARGEHALGALLMHFMLETVSAAHLLGVDPFDQLAAEEGKVLAKQYLAEGSS